METGYSQSPIHADGLKAKGTSPCRDWIAGMTHPQVGSSQACTLGVTLCCPSLQPNESQHRPPQRNERVARPANAIMGEAMLEFRVGRII